MLLVSFVALFTIRICCVICFACNLLVVLCFELCFRFMTTCLVVYCLVGATLMICA